MAPTLDHRLIAFILPAPRPCPGAEGAKVGLFTRPGKVWSVSERSIWRHFSSVVIGVALCGTISTLGQGCSGGGAGGTTSPGAAGGNGLAILPSPTGVQTPTPAQSIATISPAAPFTSSRSPVAPSATPTPTPNTPTSAAPLPTATSLPLSDAKAAALVQYNPNFEPRPANAEANNTMPTSSELADYQSSGALDSLTAAGNALILQADGQFTGTTDEILQWGAYKWGFDPNVVRAIAVNESDWEQGAEGDIGNGTSWGILQIKQSDFPATYPMSSESTAFNVDFKLAYQRACVQGDIPYLSERVPLDGHNAYPSADASEQLWGCVGSWYSGGWYDQDAIDYIGQVQAILAQQPWLAPGF